MSDELTGNEPMLHQDEQWRLEFFFSRPSEYDPRTPRANPKYHGVSYGPFPTREAAAAEAERLAEFFYPGNWKWNGGAQIVSPTSHAGDIVDFVIGHWQTA